MSLTDLILNLAQPLQSGIRNHTEAHGIANFILHWQVPHALPASVVAAGAFGNRLVRKQTLERVRKIRASELKDSESLGSLVLSVRNSFRFSIPKDTNTWRNYGIA